MMSPERVTNTDSPMVCSHCNAKQLGPSKECWLCGKPLAERILGSPPFAEMPAREPAGLSFSLATMLLLMTLASVCMGLLVAVPGWGVLACIIMVPVFFRTMRVVRHREAVGLEVSSAEKVLLFLTSFAVSSVLVIVVCVAAFCSFCGVCLTIYSLGNSQGEGIAWGIGMCTVAATGIFVVVKMIRASRRRYRRDIGEE